MPRFRNIAVWLVLGLISTSVSIPLPSGPKEDSNGIKRVNDQDVKAIVDELTKLVGKLNIENFEGDFVLEQFVDKLNDYTSYKLPGLGRKGSTLYERKSNDLEKEAIVLQPSEDRIHVRRSKRTYVGLRRAGGDDDRYYVFFIYLRYDPLDSYVNGQVSNC
jgi:hypothetical protein